MSNTLNILIGARALLNNPAHWTQQKMAKTAQNESVYYDDPRAVRWCALGATFAVASRDGILKEDMKAMPNVESLLTRLTYEMERMPLTAYNDAPIRNHAEILNLFDIAIRVVKETA